MEDRSVRKKIKVLTIILSTVIGLFVLADMASAFTGFL